MISTVIGWNIIKNKPNDLPGLFGYPKGYLVSTESQNSGNLHAHMLIWIHGLPATMAQYSSLSENSLKEFKLYQNNLVSTNLPLDYDYICAKVLTFLTNI